MIKLNPIIHSDVQHPLPTDGDSIYVKDLDLNLSANNGFSGNVTDYFDSLTTVNVDSSITNPKTVRLWFKRTIYSSAVGFGCDDLTKSFSNIKVMLLGSGGTVRRTIDLTADSTPLNSKLVQFSPSAFNGVLIEFHTINEVGLSNITIRKDNKVDSTISAVKPDGTTVYVKATASGNLAVANVENGLSIAKGDVPGTTYIHKFGNAPDFDTADGGTHGVTIWDGANDADIAEMVYTYSTTDAIDSLSSTDSGDNQQIEIQGLDVNYTLVDQTITLNGQNRVALTTNLLRVSRMKNINGTDIAGYVYCYENTAITSGRPNDTTLIRAVIEDGNNQTEMALFTIPEGKTGYLRSWFASSAGAKKDTNYIMRLRARPIDGVFQLKHRGSITDGSPYQHKYVEPEKFAEKTDIEMTSKLSGTGVTGAAVAAGFDIVLVDNV